MSLDEKRRRLLELIASFDRCVVALSGGVDSAVVARAARAALGRRAAAVTAASASVPEGELDGARELARRIGIEHHVVQTRELANPDYQRNAPDRCYHCKSELYTVIERLAPLGAGAVIVNGANADDLSDYRPGMRAAGERQVRSPLAECGIAKDEVRQLARHWQLPVWDKPAMPCLASRLAYGEQVTPERLAMVDGAERLLRARGLRTVRVRYHAGDLARLEVPLDALAELCAPGAREELVEQLHQLGFRYVTLDLEGFRSGSLNQMIVTRDS